jgi:hypothetical protein
MGWTSSGDMRQQLRLRFNSKQEAIAYCDGRVLPISFLKPACEMTRDGLCGQFFLQAPRRVDALIVILHLE